MSTQAHNQAHARVPLAQTRPAKRRPIGFGVGGGMGVKSNVDCRCGVRSCLGTPVVVSTGTGEHKGGRDPKTVSTHSQSNWSVNWKHGAAARKPIFVHRAGFVKFLN